jgi:hypothetical protein
VCIYACINVYTHFFVIAKISIQIYTFLRWEIASPSECLISLYIHIYFHISVYTYVFIHEYILRYIYTYIHIYLFEVGDKQAHLKNILIYKKCVHFIYRYLCKHTGIYIHTYIDIYIPF